MSKMGSKSNISAMRSGLYETETQRLQREADKFTQKLEKEKRHLVILEDLLSEHKKKLKDMQDKMREMRPSTTGQKRNAAKLKVLENQLDKAIVKYNSILAQNDSLKKEIDKKRKERIQITEIGSKLEKQISSILKAAKEKNQEAINENEHCVDTNISYLSLQQKSEAEKRGFIEGINQLKQKLKDLEDIRKLGEGGHTKDVMPNANAKNTKSEFSNRTEILNIRSAKLKASNREKKRIIDQYVRNVRTIREAFEQIQNATGISSTSEIVTTFIKSEEQAYSLLNFINALNQDIDNLEEAKKDIEKELNKRKLQDQKSAEEKRAQITQMENQIEAMIKNIQDKELEIEDLKNIISQIQKPITAMMVSLKKSPLSKWISVAQEMPYDETTHFNESNITAYLAEAEEYISNLLAVIANKNSLENPIIKALPLEKMTEKNFNRAPLKAEAPDTKQMEDFGDSENEFDIFEKSKSEIYQKVLQNIEKRSTMLQQSGIIEESKIGNSQELSQLKMRPDEPKKSASSRERKEEKKHKPKTAEKEKDDSLERDPVEADIEKNQ